MKAKQKERKKTLAVKEVKTHALNGAVYEKILIESGLKKLGIGGDYEIVITDNPDLVENTAAETLQKFLFKAGLNIKLVPEAKSAGKKRFLLGRDSNLKAIAQFSGSGKLNLRDVPAEDDGFHLKRIGADLVMAGANPRGVLYSVYAFEDFIIAGATGPLDIRTVPYYRKRGSGAAYYHNNYINLMTDDFSEEKAAYLARLGINQLISDDGWGVKHAECFGKKRCI